MFSNVLDWPQPRDPETPAACATRAIATGEVHGAQGDLAHVGGRADTAAVLASEEFARLKRLCASAGMLALACDAKGCIIGTDVSQGDREARLKHSWLPALQHCLTTKRAHSSSGGCTGQEGAASSAVAPVFDEHGRLAGAVAVFAQAGAGDWLPLALALVVDTARQIEERRFRETYRDHCVIAMRSHRDHRAILLAIDGRGLIVGADRAARRVLGCDAAGTKESRSFWTLFRDLRQNPLPTADHDRQRVVRAVASGEAWYALFSPAVTGDRRAKRCAELPESTSPVFEPLRLVTSSLSRRQRERVVAHIESNLHGAIRVDEMARLACLSVNHFSRAFKADFGASPHAYVVARRVELATELLSRGDACLSDVALAAGFADQSHLSRHFRSAKGVPPGAFRRAMQGA